MIATIARRVLLVVSAICWILMLAAWFPAALVEREALQQPEYRAEQFTEPLRIKGVIRYVTPTQRNWYVGAKNTFHAGWIFGALATIVGLAWDRRRNAAGQADAQTSHSS